MTSYYVFIARSKKGGIYAYIDLGFKRCFIDLDLAVCLTGVSYSDLQYIEDNKPIKRLLSCQEV